MKCCQYPTESFTFLRVLTQQCTFWIVLVRLNYTYVPVPIFSGLKRCKVDNGMCNIGNITHAIDTHHIILMTLILRVSDLLDVPTLNLALEDNPLQADLILRYFVTKT